jgi:hypothetical protein
MEGQKYTSLHALIACFFAFMGGMHNFAFSLAFREEG